MVRTGRPKKDRAYNSMLRVRVLPEHNELIRQAAQLAARRKGTKDVSSWIREVLVAAARREVARAEGNPEGLPLDLG